MRKKIVTNSNDIRITWNKNDWTLPLFLTTWINKAENRLKKLEELTKADDYELETKTELVKKSK